MVQKTQEIFDELSVDLDPTAELDSLKFAERQVVEIVRSLAQARLLGITHPVILHDEPTSALSREQIEFFFDFVRRIKNQAAQVFVSHRLDEIIELCDRMVVLKDGTVVSVQNDPTALTEKEIHSLMVGREAERHTRAARTNDETEPRLELSGFTGEGFSDISLQILPGEVLGVAGVVGSGKSDLGRAVFELGQGATGTLKVNGVEPARQGSRAGIRSSLGYVSNERHRDGIIAGMSVSHNISLPEIGAALGPVIVSGNRETTNADTAIKDLNIKAPGPDTLVGNLSGGNQQKVLLARWITLGSKLLVLDNPTNGVDVGAKAEIYRIIEGLTQQGVSVMLISDDLPEILSMSDRIVVMSDGRMEQVGNPFEIYNYPSTRFVAGFVGTLNILKARVVDVATGQLTIDGQDVTTTRSLEGSAVGSMRTVALRPEAVSLGERSGSGNSLTGTIEEVGFLGSVVRIKVRIGENAVSLDTFNSSSVTPPKRGDTVSIVFTREDLLVLEGPEPN